MPKPIEVPTIYCITSVGNNRKYIGSTTNYKRRKSQHLHNLRHGNHFCPELQQYYNKFGEDYIKFAVVEEVQTYDRAVLLDREQYYIDTLNPEYNVSGTSKKKTYTDKWRLAVQKRNVDRIHTDEEDKRRAESIKEFYRNHKKPPMLDETKEKIRQANLGENNPGWGITRTEETRKKMSDSSSKIEYTLQSPDGELIIFRNTKNPQTNQRLPPLWIIKRLVRGEREILDGKHSGWKFISRRNIE